MADVLKDDLLHGVEVVTGEKLATKKKIQWISVIELPVENFVRKNEVVLTTAIGCEQDPHLFTQFVEDVIESEAAALMVALGRFIFDIPREAIELAEKNHFILMIVPWEVRFANIVEMVMKELNITANKEREKSEKIQQDLLNLILMERDLEDLLAYIEEQIYAKIYLTDRFGNLMESDQYARDFEQQWKQLVLEGVLPTKHITPANQDPFMQKFDLIHYEKRDILQVPVLQISGEAQGYLFVFIPEHIKAPSFLTHNRTHILEHAATTIALWLSRKNAIEETKLRLRSDFVEELAKGGFQTYEQAQSRASLLQYQLNLAYVCIVGLPENLKSLYEKREQTIDSFERWRKSMLYYMEEEMLYAAQSLGRKIMLTRDEEMITLYLEIQHQTEHEYATDFLDIIDRRLNNLLPDVYISWGIGKRKERFEDFQESYRQAKFALQIGRVKDKHHHRTWFEQTRVDRVLLQLTKNVEMREIIMDTIEPLVQYDEERQMDLIGTFVAFNQYRGNVSQTARSLNLHRQSLLYRLRKIESLTNLSLNDPDHLFLLDLSIKTWRVGGVFHGELKD
ncbi:PucR family transcriptional regulator [Alkalihalobacillus alcalophilus ATCC 27647 = CGMCC 1.3604]|uniref:PucR family transcriptional regulator n=1 Tax=Alkalihalobacillus alcalophilus ATCC 27647 = CGMCC 1.3604 TaxID=1218173 RepID=A0A4S4K104_ALKAL|nr:PucR family transcriptional regulator [Alkalihalobacillus alcalophilus ATCC 27647 = CGMCC 1.3604]